MAEDIHANLARTRIAPDLHELLDRPLGGAASGVTLIAGNEPIAGGGLIDVIIELNGDFPGGAQAARDLVVKIFLSSEAVPPDQKRGAMAGVQPNFASMQHLIPAQDWRLLLNGEPYQFGPSDQIRIWPSLLTEAYIFARLSAQSIIDLTKTLASHSSETSTKTQGAALVYKIWRDHVVSTQIYESVRTIKADAARAAFTSAGSGVVWAVADTGVDQTHPHFKTHSTLTLPGGLRHCDFTQPYGGPDQAEAAALTDTDGHGSHVAGIIAGACYKAGSVSAKPGLQSVNEITVHLTVRSSDDQIAAVDDTTREEITGIAPLCKILSLKVLQSGQTGAVSNLLAAIGYIQQTNNYGRDLKIHGLNLSLGYPFDADWFAAGQSPLCAEVNRLVKCGVSVVVSAGNAGYGRVAAVGGVAATAALPCTIADPGNAELALTVGSTHRNRPHVFGVSYFSAKGPTADGREKPDLVAPGERIVSCQAGANRAIYKEDSGTSMAAPHVSAAIAAFLSVRAEFIGRPEDVKAILMGSAVDLKRRPEFQGAGLDDLMKALQSV